MLSNSYLTGFFKIISELSLTMMFILGFVYVFSTFGLVVGISVLAVVGVTTVITVLDEMEQERLHLMAKWDEHGEDL